MFNFDRYLNEYLMYQNNLTSPLKIFQPSPEKTEEKEYRSPIMDSSREALKGYPKGKKRIPEPASPSPESDQVPTFSNDGRSLKDLIEELDKEFK